MEYSPRLFKGNDPHPVMKKLESRDAMGLVKVLVPLSRYPGVGASLCLVLKCRRFLLPGTDSGSLASHRAGKIAVPTVGGSSEATRRG